MRRGGGGGKKEFEKPKTLSVVVPVYNAKNELLELMQSMEVTDFLAEVDEVLFINDCSPDPEILPVLYDFESKYSVVKVIENATNQGFLKTANEGMARANSDVVVILNEDTKVPFGFKDSVIRAFASNSKLVVACPISTHSGWFNIPVADDHYFELAQKVKEHFKNAPPMPFDPEGFCFCVRKAALPYIGKFDEVLGHGYSEEDDLVLRAVSLGYESALIRDCLVVHRSHASFSPEGRLALMEKNKPIFRERWGTLQSELRTKYNQKQLVKDIEEEIKNLYLKPEDTLSRKIQDWYLSRTKMALDLDYPKTYNEKVQWLKAYDLTPIKTKLADKLAVRDYVAEKIGSNWLTTIFGEWESFNEIDFDSLPERFVLKTNYGSGQNIVVTDKATFNQVEAKKKFDDWLSCPFGVASGFEMHYYDIPRRIFAEGFLDVDLVGAYDWAVFCVDGEPKLIRVVYGGAHSEGHGTRIFYDTDWNKQPFTEFNPTVSDIEEPRPENLEELLTAARVLSKGFKHVWVDFFRLRDGRFLFAEMTFTRATGLVQINPPEWNRKLGDLIDLPKGPQADVKWSSIKGADAWLRLALCMRELNAAYANLRKKDVEIKNRDARINLLTTKMKKHSVKNK